MKAVVLYKKGELRYEDVPEPDITSDDEVKVRITVAGICGSDQHYYLEGGIGTAIKVRQPLIIGHEGCGIIERVGSNVLNLKTGDMVLIRPARPCFNCGYCRIQKYTYCENMRHLGSAATFPHTDGLFAQKIVVHKEQCFKVNNLKPEIGAFAEPLGVAYNGIHRAGDIIGKNVLVMGAGPIGCLCAAVAKTLGAASVTVMDIRQKPLDIALKMGADVVVNSKEHTEILDKLSEHKGYFDVSIEASGNGFACVQAMKMTKPEGTISQVGMFGLGHEPKDLGSFAVKGLVWHGVFRFYDEFKSCVNALERGIINPLPLLSASFPASQCQKAMDAALSPNTAKVQLRFDQE